MAQFLEITVLCEITTTYQGSWPVDDDNTYIRESMAVLLLKDHRYIVQAT